MPGFSIPEKLLPFIEKKKRFKIAYGGRGAGKSQAFRNIMLMKAQTEGVKILCLREMQNSIEDSVHSMLSDGISEMELAGFEVTQTAIRINGVDAFKFRGLARNPDSVKSLHDFSIAWVEEAQAISKNSLQLLTPTIRTEDSELWFSMNPGSSADPMYARFIKPFESILNRDGYYEDDLHLIIKINYLDNPYFPAVLEQERLWDKEHQPITVYNNVWLGATNDEIDNSIIRQEWFNAAIDAHKLPHLAKAFEPTGVRMATHDPSGGGSDAKSYVLRHGSVILKVKTKATGEIDQGCDWATRCAIEDRADWFVYDGDGMGAGLVRQVSNALYGKHIKPYMFRGSLSGKGQDSAKSIYQPSDSHESRPKSYADTFLNNRAQYSTLLADKFYAVYRCVVRGEYVDPANMISLDSDGIDDIDGLRSECCRIPKKDNDRGLIQILGKKEMAAMGIRSPNMFDGIMMQGYAPPADAGEHEEINFSSMY